MKIPCRQFDSVPGHHYFHCNHHKNQRAGCITSFFRKNSTAASVAILCRYFTSRRCGRPERGDGDGTGAVGVSMRLASSFQVIRRQVRIAQDHTVRLPVTQFLCRVKRLPQLKSSISKKTDQYLPARNPVFGFYGVG